MCETCLPRATQWRTTMYSLGAHLPLVQMVKTQSMNECMLKGSNCLTECACKGTRHAVVHLWHVPCSPPSTPSFIACKPATNTSCYEGDVYVQLTPVNAVPARVHAKGRNHQGETATRASVAMKETTLIHTACHALLWSSSNTCSTKGAPNAHGTPQKVVAHTCPTTVCPCSSTMSGHACMLHDDAAHLRGHGLDNVVERDVVGQLLGNCPEAHLLSQRLALRIRQVIDANRRHHRRGS